VRRGTAVAFTLGVAAAALATLYAGAGAVARALASLHIEGLLLISILHVPVGVTLGVAWWFASGRDAHVSLKRFCWGRFVRDAGAELLPFSQLGGFVLGVRVLGPSRATLSRGAVAMSVDLVMELTAKLPYVAAALAVVLLLAPRSSLGRLLALALLLTCIAAAIPLVARGRMRAMLEGIARAIGRRWPAAAASHEEVRSAFDRAFAHRASLLASLALHVGCWFLGALEAWVLFRLLGIPLTLLEALAIDGAVAGLRTFGFLVPAAAGVQEASYLIGAGIFGIPPAVALAASFARRARDLALGAATFAIAVPTDRGLLPVAFGSARKGVKTDTRSR
jgi:glycosyltransferase 2 family protein